MSKEVLEKRVTILWGLPASGKTTYAEALRVEAEKDYSNRNKLKIIDVDQLDRSSWNNRSLKEKIAESIENAIVATHIVLDGLITTNSAVIELCKYVSQKLPRHKLAYEIVWWTKDTESCLHNDQGRRKLNSEATIRNQRFEEPDYLRLQDFVQNRIKRMEVIRKPQSQVWAERLGLDKGKLLKSNTWSLGGESGSCYGERHRIDPEPAPANFKEFDDLLEGICPDIKFMHYRRIYNETVVVKDKEEHDYYNTHFSKAWYECDLTKLYALLCEYGYIKDGD